jgi:DNA-binding CsgD family transcriptional regulator
MGQLATEAPTTAAVASPAEAVPSAVIVADVEGHVLAANRPACIMLGRSRIDLLMLELSDVGVPTVALAPVYARADARGLADGAGLLRHRDGRPLPIRYQVTRVELSTGPVYLWALNFRRAARRPQSRHPGRLRAARALRLTGRELEILQLIADGSGNRDISKELSISLETVKTHLRRLFVKLEARGRAHAVAIAWRRDLVD